MDEKSLYVSFCRFTTRHFPALVSMSAKQIEKIEQKVNSKTKSSAFSKFSFNLLLRLREKKREEIGTRERMKKWLKFARYPLEPEDILAAAWFGALISIFITFSIITLILFLGGLGVVFYFLPISFVGPFAVYSLLVNYPEIQSKKLRIKSLGSAPEAITYMAMSMKLSPSLNKAITFSADNTEEPLAGRLRGVLWDVYTRKQESIEESFVGFANEWGEWNEDMKRSFYGILSAAGESTSEGLDRSLGRAQDTVRAGVRRRIEEFASSLKMPSTAFFALCVLLPLVIGTTLPVLALGGIGIPSIESTSPSPTFGGGVQVILLLDVVFPAVAFVYSLTLLTKRPGTTRLMRFNSQYDSKIKRRWVACAIAISLTPLFFLFMPVGVFAPIAVLWSIVLGVSTYLLLSTSGQRRMRKEIQKLEQQMPDALFIIGNKLSEGVSVEQALTRAADSLKGMEIAIFLERLRFTLQLYRRGLEDTLFGREGLLNEYPSRTIKVALRMVVDFSRKDPSVAGKALVDFSHYLRDLHEIEKDIKSKLGEIVDAMKSTASFFAPLVLGITSALYLLLSKSFGNLASLPISSQSFVGALGVYLFVMVPIITNFSIGLETGGDKTEFANTLGKTWPLAMALFTLAIAISVMGLGI